MENLFLVKITVHSSIFILNYLVLCQFVRNFVPY
ncbi:hypothetical protein SAMN05192561_1164 [Halopenitus malekzadehii]|uniref:Uncharacterized protein n=1 Tax=Halopenitus malekzadehii TaxID=1267564 RepID=A0A1H6JL72_9EURY|nr:hypothetical protein SAMN05192561_1164 [Halopenitus malekzadehii]